MKPADPRILTINGGSSNIKFPLFEAGICSGGFWRAGLGGLDCRTLQVKGSEQADNFSRLVTAPDHTAAACRARRTVLERKLPPKAGPAIEGATA